MKKSIKNKLREDLKYYGIDSANPESDKSKIGVKEDSFNVLDNDVIDKIDSRTDEELKKLAREFAPSYDNDINHAFAVISERIVKRYDTNY